MRRLRVANIRYFSSVPYRVLSECEEIDYHEYSPAEVAHHLNVGNVDVALLPVTDYASHGGYVGLDFGLVGTTRNEGVLLLAERPVTCLRTIYLDSTALTAPALLRLLLAERWRPQAGFPPPRLIRVPKEELLQHVTRDAGALVIGDLAISSQRRFPYAQDLTAAWHEWTQLPFVFAVWACRPEVLTREDGCRLVDLFFKGTRARESLALDFHNEVERPVHESTAHICEAVQYYLTPGAVAGLNYFFEIAARYKLVPPARYLSSKYGLFSSSRSWLRRPTRAHLASIRELMDSATGAGRLSVTDCLRLAGDAPLAQLVLTAEQLADRDGGGALKVFVRRINTIDVAATTASALAHSVEKIAEPVPCERVRLVTSDADLVSPALLEAAVARCHMEQGLPIEISMHLLQGIVAELVPASTEHLERLRKAGVVLVDVGNLTEMVRGSAKQDGAKEVLSPRNFQLIRWLHLGGVATNCYIEFHPEDNWDTRLIVLERLRALQDETPGIEAVNVRAHATDKHSESYVRFLAIARIFLDNIPRVAEEIESSIGSSSNASRIRAEAIDTESARSGVEQGERNSKEN